MKPIELASLLLILSFAVRLSAQEGQAPDASAAQPAADGKASVPKVKKVKKGKGKKKAKNADDYENSKYKAVIPSAPRTYRFDAAGNPVQPKAPKKKGKKKKEALSSEEAAQPSEEKPEGSAECEGEACKSE